MHGRGVARLRHPTAVLLCSGGALVGLGAVTGAPAAVANAAARDGGVVSVGAPRPLAPVGGAGEGGPALSGDGRYVAYAVSAGASGRLHRRLQHKDLATGDVQILNRRPDGRVAGGNYTLSPSISGDGRRVAFTSNSAQLTGDGDGRSDGFVRDVPSAVTSLVSGADGQVGSAAISGDGRRVVFTSTGTDLVPGSSGTNSDVYLRELSSGAVTQVSVRPDGTPSRGPGATDADLSDDGSRVAFLSYATDLAAADGDDGEPDLFLRDLSTGTTRWLGARIPAGAQPAGVVLSGDGRWVATRYADGSVHAIRTATGETVLIAADGQVGKGGFSADGRLLGYLSNGRPYVRDLVSGRVTALPTPAGGSAGTTAALSGNGRRAAYEWVPSDGGLVSTYLVDLTRG